jgi:hypothetical protein
MAANGLRKSFIYGSRLFMARGRKWIFRLVWKPSMISKTGAVLGIDVGFSIKTRSNAIFRLV